MIKCMITGNLTRDPIVSEREFTNKSTAEITKATVCNFTVAANHGYGDSQTTAYFRVAAWRGLGDVCAKYLKKGRGVLVSGPVKQNNYIDANGNVRTVMEIRAEEIQFLGSGKTESVETPEVPVEEIEDLPY